MSADSVAVDTAKVTIHSYVIRLHHPACISPIFWGDPLTKATSSEGELPSSPFPECGAHLIVVGQSGHLMIESRGLNPDTAQVVAQNLIGLHYRTLAQVWYNDDFLIPDQPHYRATRTKSGTPGSVERREGGFSGISVNFDNRFEGNDFLVSADDSYSENDAFARLNRIYPMLEEAFRSYRR